MERMSNIPHFVMTCLSLSGWVKERVHPIYSLGEHERWFQPYLMVVRCFLLGLELGSSNVLVSIRRGCFSMTISRKDFVLIHRFNGSSWCFVKVSFGDSDTLTELPFGDSDTLTEL
ncbi:hypothetical protein VNO77_02165 [Canavalia gladiata]|uniref:Uncharacterized protein n=1 Tax=Canavalia gladiata TaxID=3824 RepID=A0AAN9RB10_CANGL